MKINELHDDCTLLNRIIGNSEDINNSLASLCVEVLLNYGADPTISGKLNSYSITENTIQCVKRQGKLTFFTLLTPPNEPSNSSNA
jgi:hypothetical protein